MQTVFFLFNAASFELQKDTTTEENVYYRAHTTSDENLYSWSNTNSSLYPLTGTNGEDTQISPEETISSHGNFSTFE